MKMGLAIARRREALGLTQEELANAVGVTKGSISRWESGDISNMRRDRIQKLAKALKVSPVDLLAEETEGLKENSQDDDILTAFPDLKDFYGDDVPAFFSQHDLTEWIDILIKLDEEQLKQLHQYAEFLNHQKSD